MEAPNIPRQRKRHEELCFYPLTAYHNRMKKTFSRIEAQGKIKVTIEIIKRIVFVVLMPVAYPTLALIGYGVPKLLPKRICERIDRASQRNPLPPAAQPRRAGENEHGGESARDLSRPSGNALLSAALNTWQNEQKDNTRGSREGDGQLTNALRTWQAEQQVLDRQGAALLGQQDGIKRRMQTLSASVYGGGPQRMQQEQLLRALEDEQRRGEEARPLIAEQGRRNQEALRDLSASMDKNDAQIAQHLKDHDAEMAKRQKAQEERDAKNKAKEAAREGYMSKLVELRLQRGKLSSTEENKQKNKEEIAQLTKEIDTLKAKCNETFTFEL
jgi:hypothetical protein